MLSDEYLRWQILTLENGEYTHLDSYSLAELLQDLLCFINADNYVKGISWDKIVADHDGRIKAKFLAREVINLGLHYIC